MIQHIRNSTAAWPPRPGAFTALGIDSELLQAAFLAMHAAPPCYAFFYLFEIRVNLLRAMPLLATELRSTERSAARKLAVCIFGVAAVFAFEPFTSVHIQTPNVWMHDLLGVVVVNIF